MIPSKISLQPPLQVSKWQKCPLLLEIEEMVDLLHLLNPFYFVQTSGLIKPNEAVIEQKRFMEVYTDYICTLKKKEVPDERERRSFFSLVMTNHLEALYTVSVNPHQHLVKIQHPVIQMQSHRFDYSSLDKKFRSMVTSPQSISWGILFSYPHLYQDANFNVFSIQDTPQFPNTLLFKKIQKWMRMHTLITSFKIEEKVVHVPIRLGKKCLKWINDHPQLQARNLQVFFKVD